MAIAGKPKGILKKPNESLMAGSLTYHAQPWCLYLSWLVVVECKLCYIKPTVRCTNSMMLKVQATSFQVS